jgi:hypothetical protein
VRALQPDAEEPTAAAPQEPKRAAVNTTAAQVVARMLRPAEVHRTDAQAEPPEVQASRLAA